MPVQGANWIFLQRITGSFIQGGAGCMENQMKYSDGWVVERKQKIYFSGHILILLHTDQTSVLANSPVTFNGSVLILLSTLLVRRPDVCRSFAPPLPYSVLPLPSSFSLETSSSPLSPPPRSPSSFEAITTSLLR